MQIDVQPTDHQNIDLVSLQPLMQPISATNSSNALTIDSVPVISNESTNQTIRSTKSKQKKKKTSKSETFLPSDGNSKVCKNNENLGTDGQTDKSGHRVPASRLLRANCSVCDKQFKKTYLREHMKIHDNERPYKCIVCGKTYRWRTLLRNHKKTHLTDNPFTCPVCGLRMSSKFSVQQHVIKAHDNGNKKYECNECDKKYVTIHQLRAHQKYHSTDRTRQCEFCGKVYKHKASLERHRRLHKGEENSVDLRLKCSSCGLICHSKTHYTAHQRIHTGEKPFVCETCGKTFRQIAQLNQHKIVHTELRPFSCNLCDRTFRCRSNLRLHLDHHNGEPRHTHIPALVNPNAGLSKLPSKPSLLWVRICQTTSTPNTTI
ncbi:unnamed protein product [Oppiella nova]|uniref:C2H2-type domain-containing protein n=1 Tax=Oppiella nova TaxID=334625 RepID=A0A7R9L812_9ACAR|nr:unnamed protein product [Oppiella nova]CAG2158700.1 unnamed protein product [Oppiella nova]